MLNSIASNYLSGRSDASLVRVHPEMESGQIRKIEAIDRLPVDEIKGFLLRDEHYTAHEEGSHGGVPSVFTELSSSCQSLPSEH